VISKVRRGRGARRLGCEGGVWEGDKDVILSRTQKVLSMTFVGCRRSGGSRVWEAKSYRFQGAFEFIVFAVN